MKFKNSILFVLLAFSCVAYSQLSSKNYIGGFVAYGAGVESLGLGVLGEFYFMDEVSFSPQMVFFYFDKERSFSEINTNLNYHFIQNQKVDVYALGGINLSSFTRRLNPFKGISSDLGLNVGAGFQLEAIGDFVPFAELKYVFGSSLQEVLFVGVKMNL